MPDTAQLKSPLTCTEAERAEFAHLVRQGFHGSDEGLPGRIRDASCLAFQYTEEQKLMAIAALKVPTELHREDLFGAAEADVSSAGYELELGWVYVVPDYRGSRIATHLCRLLLGRVSKTGVFATTRSNNSSMRRILHALDFGEVGKPFPRRNEELVLFLRSPSTPQARNPTL